MVRVKMVMGARISETEVAEAGEIVDVTPGAARVLIGSNKAVMVTEPDAPVPGVLTSRDPQPLVRDPSGPRRKK